MTHRILVQSLKRRGGEIDVALWEEIDRNDAAHPLAWIVTSVDRPDHEWRYDTEAQAHYHYNQLAERRQTYAPRAYEVRP